MKKVKFDLQKALAGAKVVTRDGQKVTELHHFKTSTGFYVVCAIIAGDRRWYTNNGFYVNGDESMLDLFILEEIQEI